MTSSEKFEWMKFERSCDDDDGDEDDVDEAEVVAGMDVGAYA